MSQFRSVKPAVTYFLTFVHLQAVHSHECWAVLRLTPAGVTTYLSAWCLHVVFWKLGCVVAGDACTYQHL